MYSEKLALICPWKGLFDSDGKIPTRRERKARRAGGITLFYYPNVHSPIDGSTLWSCVAHPGHGFSITNGGHAG
jgi:hypothetical protein